MDSPSLPRRHLRSAGDGGASPARPPAQPPRGILGRPPEERGRRRRAELGRPLLPTTGSGASFSALRATIRLTPGLNIVRCTHHGAAVTSDAVATGPGGTVPGATLPLSILWRFDNVDGNSRTDVADVVLFFNQMTWIAANEPVGPFDYNANGRIDFAGVAWLFNNL